MAKNTEIHFQCRFQLSTNQWKCKLGPVPESCLTPAEFTEFVTTIRQIRIKPNTSLTIALPGTQPCKVEMKNVSKVVWGRLIEYLTTCENSYQEYLAKLKPPPDGQHRNEHS